MASPTIDELLQHQKFNVLNEDQVASFMNHGFLKLPGAIPLDKCDWWSRNVWNRLGMDRNDKSTWFNEANHMAKQNMIAARDIAPVAWQAICEILGGEDRVHKGGEMWSDAFIVNLGSPEHEGKRLPPKELIGWHVDGDFFNHFLDSPEQALLVIPCWTDVEEDGGATWICTEGMKRIGQMLYDHPEGLNPMMRPVDEPVAIHPESPTNHFCLEAKAAADENFYQMTGKKGDVILMHPLMLHSVSRNALRKERVITNPPVSLREPFCFNRENPAEYSLVELKTMKDLGGPEKFKNWKITGPRKIFLPAVFNNRSNTREKENENLRKRGLEKEIGTATQTPYILQHILKEQQQAA